MKNKKGLIGIIAVVAVVAVMAVCYTMFAPKASEGSKAITIEVITETGETTTVVNVQGNTVPTDFYFDNMMMVPAYEFKLVNPSNDEVIKNIYKAFQNRFRLRQ